MPPRISMPDFQGLSPETRAKLKRELDDLDRKAQQDAANDAGWHAHETEVLDPIVADIYRQLDHFIAAHHIELLLDRHTLEDGVVFAAAGVDITDAFVKEYNSHTAAPTPVPRARK